ncbi:MAG: DUF983 domain-containing protein [Oceanibaculum sp.]
MKAVNALRLPPSLPTVLWRGLQRRCPKCGTPGLLHSYLKVTPACGHCGEAYGHFRADDMPPWLTVFIVAHIVIPPMLMLERNFQPDIWLQGIGWSAITLALTLLLLPRCKGAVLSLMWALKAEGSERS